MKKPILTFCLLLSLAASALAKPVAMVVALKGKVQGPTGTVAVFDEFEPRATLKLSADSQLELAYFSDGTRWRIEGPGTAVLTGDEVLVEVAKARRLDPRKTGVPSLKPVSGQMAASFNRSSSSGMCRELRLLTFGGLRSGTFSPQWDRCPRADRYEVTVKQGDQTVAQASGEEVHFDLAPGEYKLSVEALTNRIPGSKSVLATAVAEVKVLSPEAVEHLERLEKQILARPDDFGSQTLLVNLYLKLGLYEDALQLSNRLLKQSDDPGLRKLVEKVQGLFDAG
ncbi:MAG: hypothetical protein KC910_22520 [Candidatus Eremiobacteraeota bacterium]|nr:hypothetical protein [Candidatus Eremiobacteraeota bacterium]